MFYAIILILFQAYLIKVSVGEEWAKWIWYIKHALEIEESGCSYVNAFDAVKHCAVAEECCHSQFVRHHYVPRSCQCPHSEQLLLKWCRDGLAREDIIPKLLWAEKWSSLPILNHF